MSRRFATAVLTIVALFGALAPRVMNAQNSQSSDELTRRAKNKVNPFYPELAKKMNITGTVRIEVTVSPNGTVKEARIVGGHPVLATAALDAAKKWRFEPAPAESSGVIEFKFGPQQ